MGECLITTAPNLDWNMSHSVPCEPPLVKLTTGRTRTKLVADNFVILTLCLLNLNQGSTLIFVRFSFASFSSLKVTVIHNYGTCVIIALMI